MQLGAGFSKHLISSSKYLANPHPSGFLFLRDLTFLNMSSDMTASEVKRAAMGIIMMPTGMLLFRPVKAEIHPLRARNQNENIKNPLNPTNTAQLFFKQTMHHIGLFEFWALMNKQENNNNLE